MEEAADHLALARTGVGAEVGDEPSDGDGALWTFIVTDVEDDVGLPLLDEEVLVCGGLDGWCPPGRLLSGHGDVDDAV